MRNFVLVFLILSCFRTIFAQTPESFRVSFSVKEAVTGDTVPDVTGKVYENGITIQQAIPNEEGYLSFVIPSGKKIQLVIEAPNYTPKMLDYDSEKMAGISIEGSLELMRENWHQFRGVIYDKEAEIFLKKIPLAIYDLTQGEADTIETDDMGYFRFYVMPKHRYQMVSLSDHYMNKKAMVNADCGDESTTKFCLTGFSYENYLQEEKDVRLITGTLTLDKIQLDKVYKLDNIYYDYNKSDIRPDAAVVLDELYNVLKINPQIKIELSSHTDSRGKDEYNLALSQKRAEAAVQYLLKKGIDKTRITPRGYGESRLINGCKNGVECPEENHQQNRRTEFKVVGLL